MNHKRISHYLIAAGILALLGVLAVSLLYVPEMAQMSLLMLSPQEPGEPIPNQLTALYYVGLGGAWCVSLIFLLALYEYFRVSLRIGREQCFCQENVRSLSRIALYLTIDGALWIVAIFIPGMFGVPSGPIWLVFLLLSMAFFALAMLAWCLGKLLARAVEMREENDLTV